MRIDAHQHYWLLKRGDYGWLTPEAGVLYDDYMPDRLRPELEKCGIQRTIVVQAAQTVQETEFLLELCEKEPTLAGAVGWLDLESESWLSDYERLLQNRYFVGIRVMMQEEADDRWIVKPQVVKALKRLAADRFPVDLLMNTRHWPHVLEMLEQVPDLRGVVDHIAKPDIKSGKLYPWKEQMAKIAKFPNIYCKLSGMVTETDHQQWKPSDLKPYITHAIDVFGTERVMFGSDWPVCLLAADYSQTYQALERVLPETFDAFSMDQLFGLNAMRFYKLS
ncbi:amidohydrolase family protein [Paenibacillus sp. MBLB4367]|uniref:amidohydrolase family protein n=1 Tax=Paenibacillus sp. MBLB4367 TaxID=3384767 RepID=UPI00390825C2